MYEFQETLLSYIGDASFQIETKIHFLSLIRTKITTKFVLIKEITIKNFNMTCD